MPIDWDKLDRDADDAIKTSTNVADGNAKVIARTASLSRLSQAELAEIIPAAADAKTLASLMKIVQSATDHNTKINQIVNGGEDMVRILMKLTAVASKVLL